MKRRTVIRRISAFILALFALLTLFLSSSIIFDWFEIRAKEGNYVMFIVWTNFIASLLSIIAAYSFIKGAKWTFNVLMVSFIILFSGFIA